MTEYQQLPLVLLGAATLVFLLLQFVIFPPAKGPH